MNRRTVLGMISGTSHDGIDVAAVTFTMHDDGVLRGTLRYMSSTPYDPALRARILAALPPAQVPFAEVCQLDTLIGQAFADAAQAASDAVNAEDAPDGVDLICTHGQTMYHWVDDGHALGTLQLGQPAWIAGRVGVPVVSDVRIRDIVAGGHGAPLVSQLDLLMLAGVSGRPAALNLGGIANVTVPRPAGGDTPLAYDVGPANALIDAAVVMNDPNGPGYDVDGRVAASGTVHRPLLDDLLAEPYYALPAPKTTGKELFHADYLAAVLRRHPRVGYADVVATVTALTAHTVADEARRHSIDTLVVSGGGWRNPTLRAMLAGQLPGVALMASDEFGIPADAKEAIAFALIGWHTWHGLHASVPSCTGAHAASILGTVTPGATPLRLPETPPAAPRSLILSHVSGE